MIATMKQNAKMASAIDPISRPAPRLDVARVRSMAIFYQTTRSTAIAQKSSAR